MTHRDFCSSLHIITPGHAKNRRRKATIDFEALVRLSEFALIFMMSVATLDRIAAGLIKAGMARYALRRHRERNLSKAEKICF